MGKLVKKPHQQRAVTDIIHSEKGIVKADRSMFISACATGKTLTGLWTVEEYLFNHVHNEQKTAVFFFPSLALISQTYETFFTQTSIDGYNPLVVCSETKIGQIAEDPEDTPDDSVVYETCTNVENVKAYLLDLSIKTKVIFVTYHSAAIVGNALLALGLKADIGSFDEAHRTAQYGGTQNMSYALLDENFPIHKRLFMTATPKHIASSDEDEKAEFSMDNQNVYGEVAHELSMRQAINSGLICDYSIIAGAMESSEEIDDENAVSVIAEAFIRGIKKTGVKTAIAFQKNIATSKAFMQWVAEHYPDIQIRHIDGTMNHAQREAVMQFLREGDGIRIVTNSRILSEGVDAPAIDMVGFLSNTSSEIDIVQRVGRVQRLLAGFPNKIGYVFVPIITNSQKEIIHGEENLLNIVANLRENDEQLRTRCDMREYDKNKDNVPIAFLLLDNETTIDSKDAASLAFPRLNSTVNAILMGGNLGSYLHAWERNLFEVENYIKKNNKRPHKTSTLGYWLRSQRRKEAAGSLSQQQKDELIAIFGESFFIENMEEYYDEQWESAFNEIVVFFKKYSRMPGKTTKNKDEYRLGLWCKTQKDYKRKGKLSVEKETKLKDAFGASFFDGKWEFWLSEYNECKIFIQNYKRLPERLSEDTEEAALYGWLYHLYRKEQKGKLEIEKRKLIIQILGEDFFLPMEEKYKLRFLEKQKEYLRFCKINKKKPINNELCENEKKLYNWRMDVLKANVEWKIKAIRELDILVSNSIKGDV